MWVGRPADTHFSAGGSSPLACADDTNNLVTHATLGGLVEDDDEDDESDLLKVAAGIALGALMTIGAFKAAPHVKAWWKGRWAEKVKLSAAAEPADNADTLAMARLPGAAFASDVEVALDEQRTRMSSAEAQRRVLEIILAAAVIADSMRALSNVQLEDGASAQLRSALGKLTVPQVTDSLNRMLETNSAPLGEQEAADLMRIFGGGCALQGQYVPLSNDRIRKALSLPWAA